MTPLQPCQSGYVRADSGTPSPLRLSHKQKRKQNRFLTNIVTGARKLKLSEYNPTIREYYGSLTPSEIIALSKIGADFTQDFYLTHAEEQAKQGRSNPFNISLVPRPNSLLSALLEQQSSPYGATNQP